MMMFSEAMANTMVIKVKYMDMLRRFSAKVDEYDELVLDMDGLRAKIFGFFGFSPDADLTLTYIDEDGDEVTLVDDDDLRDVMKQDLDFVMIYVVLNSDNVDKLPIKSSGRRTTLRSSGRHTPIRSPRGPPPLPDLSSGHTVAELLKSLPDPILGGLSKLAIDCVSKAASSSSSFSKSAFCSPLFVELVGLATEMVKNLGSRSQSRDSADDSGASAGSNASKDESKPEELLKDATTTSEVSNASKVENMPEGLLKINATTSKGSNASKDENMPKELPKCATSKVDESRPKGLPKNASSKTMPKELLECATTSKETNASKGESKPEEFLKDASSKGSNAWTTTVTPVKDFYGDLGTTVTSVTTAPVHLNYNAGGVFLPLPSFPHKKSAPPLVSPFGAQPIRPTPYKNSTPVVSTIGAPPLPKPQQVVRTQNNNPFVDYSTSSFVPPYKSAYEGCAFGASTIPAASRSFSLPAVPSSSSAPSRPRRPAFTSPRPYCAPPYGNAFGIYSSSFVFPEAVDPNGASSSYYVPPKQGQ